MSIEDGSETTDSSVGKLRYWLRFGGKTIPLGLGDFTLGRHASCALTFEDGLVSRRHAELKVDVSGATIADLGSANGVYVNGERITEPRRVGDGDRILIGSQELVIVRSTESWRPREDAQTHIEAKVLTQPTTIPPPYTEDEDEDRPQSAVKTSRADALEVLGGIAQKMLARGQGGEAERVLTGHLSNVLRQARDGLLGDQPELIAKAAGFALRLASSTKKASWANYVLSLYESTRRPMPGESIDELYSLARSMPLDLALLRRYLAALRANTSLGANDKFLVRRLEGLEQLVAST